MFMFLRTNGCSFSYYSETLNIRITNTCCIYNITGTVYKITIIWVGSAEQRSSLGYAPAYVHLLPHMSHTQQVRYELRSTDKDTAIRHGYGDTAILKI